MTSLAAVGDAAKLAFRNAARDTLFANGSFESLPVLVAYGHPGTERPDDIVMFTGVRAGQSFATYGTNRSRDEVIELDVVISCARGGGAEQEEVCGARAHALLKALDYYARQTDTTLGGTVRQTVLDRYETEGWTVENQQFQGRNIAILATFVAEVRITGRTA
jgi:hypothetical protein